MKEFTTIAELAAAKTREEIVKWSAEMGKCPYDYGGEAVPEEICKGGDDGEQCNQCWLAALKNIKCKGDKKATPKKEENLSAKDSNEGVKALKVLCKTMTKDEFYEHVKQNKVCPKDYGFPDTMANCQNHAVEAQCKDCWKAIVDVMEFKVEKEKNFVVADTTILEEEKQALIAPTNDPKVLNYVDKLVEEVKRMKAQQVEWDEVLKLKIEEAKAKVEDEKQKLQRAIDYNMAQIKVNFDQLESKETMTKKSIKLISGEVVLKKSKDDFDRDDKKLLAYFKENKLNDYIKTKEEIDWSKFKKTLTIVDGHIVDSDGGVLKIDGLGVKTIEEVLEIK